MVLGWRGPRPGWVTSIAANLQKIKQQIATAAARVGRDNSETRLLPISKTKPPEAALEARAAGYRRFGESKMQGARNKWETLREMVDIEWTVIGYLQSNKARYVARFATGFQALDSLKITSELDRRLQQEGHRLEVPVQANSPDEGQKFGLPPQEVVAFAKQLGTFNTLDARGLMTLTLFTDGAECITRCFKAMYQTRQELRDIAGEGWGEPSMGMSSDFELATECGATYVYVGQAVFRNRLDPDAYWPGIK